MADEITLDDLKQKQESMAATVAKLDGETDAQRIQDIAAELQREGEELQQLAKAFEEQEIARHGGGQRGGTEVILTPAQRQRIEAETGIQMESIWFRDDSGAMTKTMPHTDPRIVEYRALQEARRRKQALDAEQQLDAQLLEVVAAIESASPEAAAKLDELRAD